MTGRTQSPGVAGSMASPTRAVTVLILLLLVGVAGADTQTWSRMAGVASRTAAVVSHESEERSPAVAQVASVPAGTVASIERAGGTVARPRRVADAWWPPPRGPDAI